MSIFWGGIQVGLLCAAALGYGGLAAPCLEKGRTPCENFVSRFALGLGLLILVTASGGWLRLWGPWFHHGIICGGIILLMAQRPRAAHPIRPLFHQRHLLWAAPALLLLLFYAAFPPTFYDALLYHLGIPAYYLQTGGFTAWPENVFSALPQNAEMLNLLLLSGGPVHGPKFLSLAVTLALLLYLVDWGKANRLRHPWLAALIFFSIPEIVFLAVTEKNDMLLMFFLLLGVRQLASLKADPDNGRTCVLGGVFLGLAGGVKWQGLIFGAAFVAAYVLASRASWRRRFGHAALIGFIVILLIFPWLVKNQVTFGNPVHPYLSGLFAGSGESQEQARQIHEGVLRGQGFAPAAIFSFCRRMFLQPYSLGLTHITGVLILLLLPVLFFRSRLPGRGFLLSGCAVGFILLLAASRVPRYFLPVFMVLSLPMAAGWERLLEKLPRFRRIAFALLFTLMLVQAAQALSLLERMTLGGRYAWKKCRGELPSGARYLDIIPYYPAVSYINQLLPSRARVTFIGEERTFYIRRPFLAASFFDAHPALTDFLASADAGEWAGRLRRRGVTHMLYCPHGLERMATNSSTRPFCQRQRLELFLVSWPKLYDDGRYLLYAVPPS